ncbi:MAG: hypothetical protein RLN88_00205 [Ekhidna sp.]|uniref:hypothetical protein n=1 Tax=Ekhidna sp. TaxID=2608089 RepID=UPI0032EF7E05
MKNQKEAIIGEVKDVVEEIVRLKAIIRNLNERIISRTDKHGLLSFLNAKRTKLLNICTSISGQEVEILEEKEEGV